MVSYAAPRYTFILGKVTLHDGEKNIRCIRIFLENKEGHLNSESILRIDPSDKPREIPQKDMKIWENIPMSPSFSVSKF